MTIASIAGRVQAKSTRSTESVRKGYMELREHLDHISSMTGKLPFLTSAEQRNTMEKIIPFLNFHMKPPAEWKEKLLYPTFDKHSGGPSIPFKSIMRNQHKIVHCWISELKSTSTQKALNVKKVRSSDHIKIEALV